MRIDSAAKKALDKVIRKSRVHLYKPIQIAEILFHHRTEDTWNLKDLESYRNISKKWRDEVSLLLVGRRSTSSHRYQDNIFAHHAEKMDSAVEFFYYSGCRFFRTFFNAVLPYSENSPAFFSELSVRFPVSFLIAGYFSPPIMTVGGRHSAMFRASMPKTAVYKNSGFIKWENHIRLS